MKTESSQQPAAGNMKETKKEEEKERKTCE
jgi:hypothetical protein